MKALESTLTGSLGFVPVECVGFHPLVYELPTQGGCPVLGSCKDQCPRYFLFVEQPYQQCLLVFPVHEQHLLIYTGRRTSVGRYLDMPRMVQHAFRKIADARRYGR